MLNPVKTLQTECLMSQGSGLSILTNIAFQRIHHLIFTEGKVHSNDQDSPDMKSLMA